MTSKKVKKPRVKFSEGQTKIEEEKKHEAVTQLEPQKEDSAQAKTSLANAEENSPACTDSAQPTVTSTESSKIYSGTPRSVCAMHRMLMKKAQGKKVKLTYNDLGIPVGQTRHTLQSYIGMLARTMVPIDIASWPKVDPQLKAKIWSDVKVKCIPLTFV